MDVQDIKLSDIEIVENVRTNTKDHAMKELMESIKQHGLEQPIGVSQTESGKFILVYGHRRFAAYKKLGYKTIPCVMVEDKEIKDLLVLNVVENLQRKDISPIELGRICHKLKTEHSMNHGEIAAALSTTKNRVEMAMAAYSHVPIKLRGSVQFRSGSKHKNGSISASTVYEVTNIRRRLGLDNNLTTKLIELAQTEEMSRDDMTVVGELLRSGVTPMKAMKVRKEYKVVTLKALVVEDELNKRCQKEGVSTGKLLASIVYGESKPLSKPDVVVTV